MSIWWWLQRQGYTRIPSTATIARSLRRQGLSTPTPNKRPKDSYKRFQKDFANEMWQLDGIEHYIGDRMCTIYQIVDDRTRLMVALNARWGGESIAGAKAAFTQAFRRYGMPAIVLTDNGGAFNSHRRGWLNGTEKWLADKGIRPISGSVLHPEPRAKSNEHTNRSRSDWPSLTPRARSTSSTSNSSTTATSTTTTASTKASA